MKKYARMLVVLLIVTSWAECSAQAGSPHKNFNVSTHAVQSIDEDINNNLDPRNAEITGKSMENAVKYYSKIDR